MINCYFFLFPYGKMEDNDGDWHKLRPLGRSRGYAVGIEHTPKKKRVTAITEPVPQPYNKNFIIKSHGT